MLKTDIVIFKWSLQYEIEIRQFVDNNFIGLSRYKISESQALQITAGLEKREMPGGFFWKVE